MRKVTNEHDEEISKERYISLEERQKLLTIRDYFNSIMEYQRITNLLDNTLKQPSKFTIKNWVEINDEARGNTNSQIKFKN